MANDARNAAETPAPAASGWDPHALDALRERVRRLDERCAQLAIERDAARAANGARSRLLAQLSHQIRTPLDAVIGLTDAVLRTDLAEDQHERLLAVLTSAETLLGVLNDLLDFARVGAGGVELERVPFDLYDAVFDTLDAVADAAASRGLELAVAIDPGLPALLIGDPGRLRHVLAALVERAVASTERGEVVVQVGPRSSGEEIRLHVSVRDTGPGIAADRIEALLREPAAADAHGAPGPAAADAPGTPGLALCRKLVERMGGELRVESTPGSGRELAFDARIEVTEGGYQRHRRAPRPLDGIGVLIVDDHPATREGLETLTRAWGMHPVAAASAEGALAQLAVGEIGEVRFRLLLCDAQMPETGGLELVERLRADERLMEMAVVVLHAGIAPASAALCERLRIAAQVGKPVHPVRLFEAAVDALGLPLPVSPPRYRYRSARDSAPLARRPPLASPAWVAPSRILLVEDSEPNRAVILSILEEQGHAIECAASGRRALERFRPGRFDVVLLDIQLPAMDGLEVAAAIRAREAGTGCRVPIVAMTANALRGDRERCLAAGMDQYLTKPIRRGELFAALIEARRRGVGSAAAAAAGAEPPPRLPIDGTALMAMVGGDRELLREIAGAYVVEIREHLQRLPGDIAARDARGARRRAHGLQGAMRTFSAVEAERAAARLEEAAAAGDLGRAEALFADVRRAVGAVLPQLEALLAGTSE